MLSLGKRAASSSLQAVRRKVTIEVLTNLQPLLLLQMLMEVSQAVTGSVSRSSALARTLALNGQQRLRELLAAAPRLHLPVEQVLERYHSNDAPGTPEDKAARALLELCLGLLLQWMASDDRRQCTAVMLQPRCCVISSSPWLHLPCLTRLSRPRSCLHATLA